MEKINCQSCPYGRNIKTDMNCPCADMSAQELEEMVFIGSEYKLESGDFELFPLENEGDEGPDLEENPEYFGYPE